MFYGSTRMATVGVKGLNVPTRAGVCDLSMAPIGLTHVRRCHTGAS